MSFMTEYLPAEHITRIGIVCDHCYKFNYISDIEITYARSRKALIHAHVQVVHSQWLTAHTERFPDDTTCIVAEQRNLEAVLEEIYRDYSRSSDDTDRT